MAINLFANVINDEAVDNLTDEEADLVLAIFEKAERRVTKSNARCPACGEYEVVWLNHNTVDEEDPGYDEKRVHTYCKNCDYGLCEEC